MQAATVPNTIDANKEAKRADWWGTAGDIFLVMDCSCDDRRRTKIRDSQPKERVGAMRKTDKSLPCIAVSLFKLLQAMSE